MGVWPWDAPDEYEIATVRWEAGVPVELNGERLDLVAMFEETNRVAGKHGVGIGQHVVENRFVGVKSRGIYEAPGVELLGRTYEYLLQFILDRRAREFFEQISKTISVQIYQGYWLDLATASATAALGPITRLATGTIAVRMHKGGVYFESADDTPEAMPHSLYTDDSSMEATGSYDHVDAEGFVKVLGVSAKNFGKRQLPGLGG
jgi:argininosuccinate synthase